MQIGMWGTCWFTVAHSVHTFISLVFCVRQVYWLSAVVIIIGWANAFAAGERVHRSSQLRSRMLKI